MRIVKIRLKNFQSVKGEMELVLSPFITQIDGNNAQGKSTLLRAIVLFSGIYSRQYIEGLKPRNRKKDDITSVELFLEDGTKMIAIIRDTGNPSYEYRDIDDNIIQVWNEHSYEINEILNFKTINDEVLLNFKKAKFNIGIDTTPRQFAEIIEFICKDKDIEARILNFEQTYKNQNSITETIQREFSIIETKMNSLPNIDYLGLLKISDDFEVADKELVEFTTTLDYMNAIISIYNEISDEEDIKEIDEALNNVNIINELIEYTEKLKKITKYSNSLNTMQGYIEQINIMYHLQDVEKYSTNLKSTQDLEIKNRYLQRLELGTEHIINNYTLMSIVRNLKETAKVDKSLSGITNISNNLEEYKLTLEIISNLNSIKEILSGLENIKIQESSISDICDGLANIELISKCISLTNMYRDSESITVLENNINQNLENINTVKALQDNIQTVKNILLLTKDINNEIDEINASILEYNKQNKIVCPECGTEIIEGKVGELCHLDIL